jgi:hypothetical protein
VRESDLKCTVQTIRNLLRKILFSVMASNFLETKILFLVAKLFEYLTNILICNERNVYICSHYANYIKMNLIKLSCVQKICFCYRKQHFSKQVSY